MKQVDLFGKKTVTSIPLSIVRLNESKKLCNISEDYDCEECTTDCNLRYP